MLLFKNFLTVKNKTKMENERMNASELTLAPDGSLYHIRLFPEELAENVILVGDPERAEQVSKFFSSVEVKNPTGK